MNNQPPMRVRDSVADAQKELQLATECDSIRVGVNRDTLYILHHKIRFAILCMPSVKDPNNGGVIERCQELPFPQETVVPRGMVRVSPQELDRDLLLNFAIRAFAQVDSAHPS